MDVIERKLTEIYPYEHNPRKNDGAVEYVANSIAKFGFKQPIVVDKDGVIIVGHTRYKAAQKLGLETAPVVVADDLDEEKARAYRLADNKTNELADWDFEMLDGELFFISDIDMMEFGFEEIQNGGGVEKEEKPEVEFTEVLGEENNYIILKFTEDIDWLQAQSLFGLKTVKSYSTRKDGKLTKSMTRCGIGRVVDGAEFFNSLGIDL